MRSLIRRPAPEGAPRRDPAPSRWGYRYQRLMLTPSFRLALRIGLPLLLVAVVALSWFSHEANRALLVKTYADAVQSVHHRPEFMVSGMTVEGGSDALQAAVRGVVDVAFPVSSFDLDLDALRDGIQKIPAVKAAVVRVAPGGVLDIAVTPRVPVAIWRTDDGLQMIDDGGVIVGPLAARSDRLDLPLIAGDGAKDALAEALQLYAVAGPIAPRVRGLVRMGERRWDVVLDRDQRILLPTEDPVRAFERVIAMAQAEDLLKRDVTVVDVRNDNRPTIRLSEPAEMEMRRINAALVGTSK